jgi:hypothetical protein
VQSNPYRREYDGTASEAFGINRSNKVEANMPTITLVCTDFFTANNFMLPPFGIVLDVLFRCFTSTVK